MSLFVEVAVVPLANSADITEINSVLKSWVTKIVAVYPGLTIVDIELKPYRECFVLVTVTYRNLLSVADEDCLQAAVDACPA